jgi:hypothetical protein
MSNKWIYYVILLELNSSDESVPNLEGPPMLVGKSSTLELHAGLPSVYTKEVDPDDRERIGCLSSGVAHIDEFYVHSVGDSKRYTRADMYPGYHLLSICMMDKKPAPADIRRMIRYMWGKMKDKELQDKGHYYSEDAFRDGDGTLRLIPDIEEFEIDPLGSR